MDRESIIENLENLSKDETKLIETSEKLSKAVGDENFKKLNSLEQTQKIVIDRMNQKGFNLEEMSREGKTPTREVFAEAENIAKSSDGMKMYDEIKKSGLNAREMALNFKKEQQMTKRFNDRNKVFRTGVIITKNRQLKEIEIWDDIKNDQVGLKIKSGGEVHQTNCRELQIDELKDHQIKIWYDPSLQKNKNKRATKLFDFEIGGDVLISSVKKNLTIKQIEKVEKIVIKNLEKFKDKKEERKEEKEEIKKEEEKDEGDLLNEIQEDLDRKDLEGDLLNEIQEELEKSEKKETKEEKKEEKSEKKETKEEMKKETNDKKETKSEKKEFNIPPGINLDQFKNFKTDDPETNNLLQEGIKMLNNGQKPTKAMIDKANQMFPGMLKGMF